MIASGEVSAQRRLTDMFIEADWIELSLTRPTFVSDGAGGRRRSGAINVALQRFRLIPQDDGTTERLTADGQAVSPGYRLLGAFDADMERWDEFELYGKRYQIVFINQNRQYEVKGEVAYLG